MRILGLLGLLSYTLLAAETPPGLEPVSASAQAFDLPTGKWTKVAEVPPDPFGRELASGRGAYLCCDPESGQIFRYGGYTPGETNDLWSFQLPSRAWTSVLKMDYTWPPPASRPGAGPWWQLTYDPKRKVIWFGGGKGKVGGTHPHLMSDLWQYDPARKTFTAMQTKKYPAGSVYLAYDAKHDLLVRAPGEDGEWAVIHNRDATWVYDPNKNEWSGRPTKGSPKFTAGGPFVYDAATGKCVYLLALRDGKSETWTYDAGENKWEKLECDPSPPGRTYAGAVYLPELKRVAIFGGLGHPPNPDAYGYGYRGGGTQLADTWLFDGTAKKWTRLDAGEPVVPRLPGQTSARMEPLPGLAWDARNQALIVAAPTVGVWALRLKLEGGSEPQPLKLAALPVFEKPQTSDRVIPQSPPNQRLLDLEPMTWLKLGGGGGLAGGEVPRIYDEASGYILKYGGCNNGGTTFASGYGNDLSAYDPAAERWIALRYVDPASPPRPANGCTRYYAFDPVRNCVWFAGGTAGNHLSSSLPAAGVQGTWRYDSLKDRFELIPTQGKVSFGAGVVTCYDRANNRFIGVPKAYSDHVSAFNPDKNDWTTLLKEVRAPAYTYPAYVDSLKVMLVLDKGKLLALDCAKPAWSELATKGEAPPAGNRPCLAYDPEHDLVLAAFDEQAWSLDVKTLTWTALQLKGEKVKVTESLVYDRRHKVFIGGDTSGRPLFALRLKK